MKCVLNGIGMNFWHNTSLLCCCLHHSVTFCDQSHWYAAVISVVREKMTNVLSLNVYSAVNCSCFKKTNSVCVRMNCSLFNKSSCVVHKLVLGSEGTLQLPPYYYVCPHPHVYHCFTCVLVKDLIISFPCFKQAVC